MPTLHYLRMQARRLHHQSPTCLSGLGQTVAKSPSESFSPTAAPTFSSKDYPSFFIFARQCTVSFDKRVFMAILPAVFEHLELIKPDDWDLQQQLASAKDP